MKHTHIISFATCSAISLVAAVPAHAWQIETAATNGCHERITLDGSRTAGWPEGAQPPAATEHLDRLISELPFSVPDSARNPWSLSLVLGVRNNDIRDLSPSQIGRLVHIHNDPEDQKAHCIRRSEHDYSAGDGQALADCKQYILSQVDAALGGETLELSATELVGVFLEYSGTTDVEVHSFPFHMGKALHSLEDSFTHTLRSPTDGRVRHVLNWVDFAKSPDYDPARDGFQHITAVDDCTVSSEDTQRRVARSTQAAADLLAAVNDPSGGRDGRLARATAVLDRVFEIEQGCEYDNDYCGATEIEQVGGCNASGQGAGGFAALGIALMILMIGGRRIQKLVVGACGAATLLVCVHTASADSLAFSEQAPVSGYIAVSGSVDRTAAAATLGLRWHAAEWLSLGVDAEYNPWFSIHSGEMEPGTFNTYTTAIFRHGKVGNWQLHSSVNLGASVMMFDTVGVDKGSVGMYLGASILGLTIPVTDHTRVVLEPMSVSIPAPLVTGFPFFYRQYRATAGLEFDL